MIGEISLLQFVCPYTKKMVSKSNLSQALASRITKHASKQTYYTIRYFVDRDRIADAYRSYGYFRWVDDVLDGEAGVEVDRLAFADRQKSLLESCYRGETLDGLCAEEQMLVDLVRSDAEKSSGLQTYLHNMMQVMVFDAQRRGQIITQAELSEYTRWLATAVTEAMYHFIGHGDPVPCLHARYMAVTAAHITHMLRDTFEDTAAGYYNIPREYLLKHHISPFDVESWAYREWVRQRVQSARRYFKAGREYLTQTRSLRCRLAGYAYTARFEWILQAIERDRYCLCPEYSERKSPLAGLWMSWSTLASLVVPPQVKSRIS